MTPEEALRTNFEWFELVYDTLFVESDLELHERGLTRMAVDLVMIFGKLPRPVQLLHREMIVGSGFDAASPADQRKFKDAVRKTAASLGYDEGEQKRLVDAAVKSIPKARQSGIQRLAADIDEVDLDNLISEKAPPGWEGTVKKMKKHMPAQRAFALAWSMHKKGAKPHYPAKEEIEAIARETADAGEGLEEVSPPGWAGTVKAMKDEGDIDNPYALAWYMKKRGATPHYKDQDSSKKGKPVKKKRFQNEEAEGLEEGLKLGGPAPKVEGLSDVLAALVEGKNDVYDFEDVAMYVDEWKRKYIDVMGNPSRHRLSQYPDRKLIYKLVDDYRSPSRRSGKGLTVSWADARGIRKLLARLLVDTGKYGGVPAKIKEEKALLREALNELQFAMKHPEKKAVSEAKKKKGGCPCGNDHEECECEDCEKMRSTEDLDARFGALFHEHATMANEDLSIPLPIGSGGVDIYDIGVDAGYQVPTAMGANEAGGFRDVNLDDARAMVASRPPLATKIARMQKDHPVFEQALGEFTPDEMIEMGAAYDKMQAGEPLGREERVYADTYAALVVAGMRKPQATPIATVRETEVMESAPPMIESKIKLTSKERYRASASERRLYGGKTVTLFFVTPPDDGKMFTVVGYGPSPGERKKYAAKVAQQAIEKYGADAHKHFDHMGRHVRAEDLDLDLALDELLAEEAIAGRLDERQVPETAIEQYKLKIKGPGHEKLAKAIDRGITRASDLCKINPPICKKNLGLPRGQMPQFPNDVVRDRFIKHLKSQGIRVTRGRMKVGQLKATQAEIQAEKVVGMVGAYLSGRFDAIKSPIVVSRDGYIVDGHHRWAALLTVSPGETMNVIRVDAPIKALIPMVNDFPGVVRRGFAAPSIPQMENVFGEPRPTYFALGANYLGLAEGYPKLDPRIVTSPGGAEWVELDTRPSGLSGRLAVAM